MKFGFLKVAAASPKMRLADPAYNAEQIIETIAKAEEEKVEVLVFPELSLTGATIGDLAFQPLLLEGAKEALCRVQKATEGKKILVFVGLPYAFQGRIYNAVAALQEGKLLAILPKKEGEGKFAPAPKENVLYSLFDEPADEYVPFGRDIVFLDEKNPACAVGVVIGNEFTDSESVTSLCRAGATLIVNPLAQNETVASEKWLSLNAQTLTKNNFCGLATSNAGEGESVTDLVFAGRCLVAEEGGILAENAPFSYENAVSEIDVAALTYRRARYSYPSERKENFLYQELNFVSEEGETRRNFPTLPFVPEGERELSERAETVLSLQAHALKRRMEQVGAKTAVLGISGGLDSTLALLVAARAFELLKKEKKDILAVTMPGFGTTGRTYQNALAMISALGATARTVSIKESVEQHFKDIGHDQNNHNVTYENAQARERTQILMDLANETGGLVVGTGDLSELALGWCSFNGDHMSNYAVNSSVPKTLIRYLVKSEAKRLGGSIEEVLLDVVNTEISPELLPPDEAGKIAQKTEDLVGPYELHDFFLYYFIRCGYEPEKLFFLAKRTFEGEYDEKTIKKWLVNFFKRFFSQQFKRSCSVDGVKVGSVDLSPRGEWQMPSDAFATLWVRRVEEIGIKE